MGRSESGHDNGDDSEAWDDKGLIGMKRKEVGVVSDCNINYIRGKNIEDWTDN
jgi:hypothetical protein